jgi:chaperonin GroES
MKIRPLDDRIVVEPLPAEEVTKGGILLPDTAKEKPQKGKVVAIGVGKLLEDGSRSKIDLKAGDIVLFGKYAGDEIKVADKEYKILRETDIFAKEEK